MTKEEFFNKIMSEIKSMYDEFFGLPKMKIVYVMTDDIRKARKEYGLKVEPPAFYDGITGQFNIPQEVGGPAYIFVLYEGGVAGMQGAYSSAFHEIAHAKDYEQLKKVARCKSYYDARDYRTQLYVLWDEYHAYSLQTFMKLFYEYSEKTPGNIEKEIKEHAREYAYEYTNTPYDDADKLVYNVARIEGKLHGLEMYFKDEFLIEYCQSLRLMKNSPWLLTLYDRLRQYDSLEEIYPYLNDMGEIINAGLDAEENRG